MNRARGCLLLHVGHVHTSHLLNEESGKLISARGGDSVKNVKRKGGGGAITSLLREGHSTQS